MDEDNTDVIYVLYLNNTHKHTPQVHSLNLVEMSMAHEKPTRNRK